MALWVIVGLIGFIVGIIGAVMILVGIKGYQMFGGKKSKQSIIIIAIMSILGIILAEYISISISYYQAIDGLIPFQYILFDIMPTLIQDPKSFASCSLIFRLEYCCHYSQHGHS
ncbi:hypothetical protein MGH68_00860 [Erysipelothrix sp. D19-032]